MKILIAPWGNPFGWKEVEYVYNGQTEKLKDPLVLIKKVENPDKVIIISVDTLTDDYVYAFKNPSYNDIKKCAENLIFNFCQKELKNFIPDKIIISNGFGEFNHTKFIGNAIDFYYNTFKELTCYFVNLLQQINEKFEIIFDATHGINYVTILTYRTLREIFEIFAYVYDVKLKVLNSDPFVGREAKIDRLNINVIEKSKILPRISVYRSDKRPVEPCSSTTLENKSKREIGENIEDFISEISFNIDETLIFLGSFLYALPVFILSYMIDSSVLKEKIEKISEKFEKNICLKNLSKLEVFRNWEFRENFANLVKAYLVSSILEKSGFNKLNDVPLSKIKDLKNVYKNFPIESNRIDKEIGDIKGLGGITQQYEVYNEIKSNSVSNKIDKRNFFAHAGFEYNTIELKKENEEIYIRIYAGNKNFAEELIKENLPQI
jgi:CRISPR-associated protein Csx1